MAGRAAAESRGRVGKKLLEQARELRERIGQQIGRVPEWVRERFRDPVQQIKDRTRDLFEAVVEKARGARGPNHVTVTGLSGEAASPLFLIVPNPNPLVGPRILQHLSLWILAMPTKTARYV